MNIGQAITLAPEGLVNARTKRFVPSGDLHLAGYFVHYDGRTWQTGWTPSAADMLRTDWEVLPDAEGRAPGEPAA